MRYSQFNHIRGFTTAVVLLGNARGSVESNDSCVTHSTTPFSP